MPNSFLLTKQPKSVVVTGLSSNSMIPFLNHPTADAVVVI
jgi:hypothetical protein